MLTDTDTASLDMHTLRVLAENRIHLGAYVVGVSGSETVYLKPEDVVPFLADRGAWYARQHGTTKAVYEEWLETCGAPRCGGTTVAGQPCKAYQPGYQLAFHAWLRQDRAGYCTAHGGEGNPKRRKKG